MRDRKSIADRVVQFGDAVRTRLSQVFSVIGIEYPSKRMTVIGFKAERMLEIWVAGPNSKWKYLKSYPILGMSGSLGPKLLEGDRQVPEGIYRIESLNPNSHYHLALRVNYPNQEDRRRGQEDGRIELGTDIMIHGKSCSIGCLAMGDEAAEDLFVLAAEIGIGNISVILSPVDFKTRSLPVDMPAVPKWTSELYHSIKRALEDLRK